MRLARSHQISRGPSAIDLELSNRCDLRCARCWFHGENGVGDRYAGAELTTAEVVDFLHQVAEYRPRLYLGGAEPLLRDDLLNIVTHADSLSLPVSFTTNGTRLDADTARRLVESGAGEISVSIDGPQPIHDALRGPGTFAQAAAGLRHLLQARRAARTEARGFRGPSITVNVTVSPLVAGHLAETIRAVRETLAADGPAALPGALEPAASVHAPSRKGAAAGMVDSFRIHHLWFVSGAELQAHQAAVQEALGVHAPGAAAHVLRAGPGLDPEALAREIGRLRRLRGVTSFPHLRGKQIPDFYSEGPSSTRRRCGAPFHAVVIKPNGDVRYCPDEWIDDYVLGNIREHDLETIWNGSAARRFRAVLLQKGSFPGCRRCGWMYSF